MARFDLTDAEWAVIEPLLPTDVRGKERVDDQRVLNGARLHARAEAPTAAPKVDTSSITAVAPAVQQAKSAAEELNLTVTPNVDTSSIAAARQQVQALKAEIGSLGGAMAGLGASAVNGIRARGSSASFQGPDYAGP